MNFRTPRKDLRIEPIESKEWAIIIFHSRWIVLRKKNKNWLIEIDLKKYGWIKQGRRMDIQEFNRRCAEVYGE